MSTQLLTKPGTRKLSDVARVLVTPSGIVATGYPAVQQKCRELGIEHDDWQQGLGRATLAKRSNGLYAAGVGGVVLSTCRQIGKTFTFGSIIFALCILNPGTTVLWTAHHTRTSDETYETLAGMAMMPRIAAHAKAIGGNGKQAIKFSNGSRILFGAREHGFGRGIPGVTIVVFDEAQILSQRALNTMIPAANTVRNPLIVYMGTPPDPNDKSEVFKARRRKALEIDALRQLGQDASSDLLYVEIGADPDADLDDRAQWAKGNPSYPERTPDEAFMRMRAQLEDDAAFRREGLGIWDDDSAGTRAITAPLWTATSAATVPDDGARALGVAFSLDGLRLSLAGAIVPDPGLVRAWSEDAKVKFPAGAAHVELIDAYGGSMDVGLAPLADWMAERWREYSGFVLSGRAGATVLEQLLLKRKVPPRRVVVANTPIYLKACGGFFDEIKTKTVTHLTSEGQSALDDAIEVTDRRKRGTLDDAWSWTSPNGDHVHVEAVSLALYGARTLPPRRTTNTSDKPKGRIL